MKVRVSDHAIVRYLERVLGFDLGEIRKQICPDDVAECISALGSGYFPVGDSHKLRVKNGVIITVFSKDMKNTKPGHNTKLKTRSAKALKKNKIRSRQQAALDACYEQLDDWDDSLD